MQRNKYLLAAFVLTFIGFGYCALLGVGQDSGDPQSNAKQSAAPTWEVKKGPFRVQVTTGGIFEAKQMTPVAFRPLAWTPQSGGPLLVKHAVPQGARVRKGDRLITLDVSRLQQTIQDLQERQKLSELAIRLAEKELPLLEQSTPKELAAAERAKKIADEDLERFLKTDRAFSKKSAEFSLKSSRNYYEYAKEELDQLEKMYKANDLTEETEAIVLRRYRNNVESAKFSLQRSEKNYADTLKFDLPRRDQTFRETADRTSRAFAKAKATLPLILKQKQLDLKKQKYDSAKNAEKLAKLKRDLVALDLRAPADGVVYYGRCDRGKWTTTSTMESSLRRGGQLTGNKVLFTIVQPEDIFVRALVDEKHLQHLRPGTKARVTPTGFPNRKLNAKVESVSLIPVSEGKFVMRVSLANAAKGTLLPGMTCSVKLIPYSKVDALTVPSSAVFTDDWDDEKHYVYVARNGKSTKRYVTVGQKSNGRVEILRGLNAGDEILRQKPGQSSTNTKKST